MSEDLYLKLGERLNENPVKLPLMEGVLNILKEFYKPEQARVAAEFPQGLHSLKDLAAQFNRDEEALFELLEGMADRGLVFTLKTESGGLSYALTPFFPGVLEFQLVRGTDTPRDRKIARMMEELMETMESLMAVAKENPEAIKEMMPEAAARTITVEKELPRDIDIYPYEQLVELIKEEESFAATYCYCRHHAYLLDKPCRVEGVPEYSCLSFGELADFVVDRKFGKRISKDECLEILAATEKAGLVHNTNNFIGRTAFVCNCCGCCCGFLKLLKKVDFSPILRASNFMVEIEEASCAACGDCVERCQTEALSLSDDAVVVNKERCIGCGNCVSVCPTDSLSMVRRSDIKPPIGGTIFGGIGV